MSEAVAGVTESEARELLGELVSIPSPTGEEDECAERLVEFFESYGRDVWLDEVGNVRAPADDSVLLTSHIDTVPGDIPVRTETDEDGTEMLWGRGSVDAKGPLAAMAIAAISEGVSFVGVVGEEVDSNGARHLLETRDAPEAVVNGEPSGWEGITLGYRGLLAGTYVATSESGHSSRPENNAIEDAFDWWNRVNEAVTDDEEWKPVFERITPKPTEIEGGPSEDGLSVETTMDVQLRIPPSFTVEEVREIADGELNGGTVRWYDEVSPVVTNPRTEVGRVFRGAIRQVDGEPRLLRKTGTSDMNIYQSWNCPMVTYGPGDSDLDHAPDERLSLAEFDRSVTVLETVAERLAEEEA